MSIKNIMIVSYNSSKEFYFNPALKQVSQNGRLFSFNDYQSRFPYNYYHYEIIDLLKSHGLNFKKIKQIEEIFFEISEEDLFYLNLINFNQVSYLEYKLLEINNVS